MIVVRNIFRVKFGQSKEITALWKQATAMIAKALPEGAGGSRLLTDLAGPDFYTLVLETTHRSLSEWEEFGKRVRQLPEWNSNYAKIAALTDSGRREILTVID